MSVRYPDPKGRGISFLYLLTSRFFLWYFSGMDTSLDLIGSAQELLAPPTPTKWTMRLALDTAMALELDEPNGIRDLLARYNIDAVTYAQFSKDPVFIKHVDAYRAEIRDKGVTFKMKARVQAEELLATSWMLIHNPEVSPAVKADLIKSTVKWAGLEPKGMEVEAGGTGGVAITINLGDRKVEAVASTAPPVIDMENIEE